MTDKKSRRVVIINNIKSDTIDQAIFILKTAKTDQGKNIESCVAAEAQEIINEYVAEGWILQQIVSPTDGIGALVGVFYKEN